MNKMMGISGVGSVSRDVTVTKTAFSQQTPLP